MRNARLFASFTLALLLCGAVGARAQTVSDSVTILLDEAKLVQVPPGTDTIVIGNPTIADASLQKNNILVLTGRTAGRTNFLALNAKGVVISENTLIVKASVRGKLLVQRGGDRYTYDCSPQCMPYAALGDSDENFGKVNGQRAARDQMLGIK